MSDNTPLNREVEIEKYLRNELKEKERSKFEVMLLEDSSLLEDVQIRQRLIEGLREQNNVQQTGTESPPFESEDNQNSTTLYSNFLDWIRQPPSIAATALIAVGVTFTISNQLQSVSPIEDLSSVRSRVVLETVRGDANIVTISGNAPILLAVDVGLVFEGVFNLSIVESQTGEEVARLEAIELSEPGRINVLLNIELEGEHSIIALSSDQEILQSYTVRFTN